MPSSESADSNFYDSESDDEDDCYGSNDDLKRKIFGKNEVDSKSFNIQIYCAICAGKHSEEKCPNKNYSKS